MDRLGSNFGTYTIYMLLLLITLYSNPKSFVNFLLPSERVRGGLGWGKNFTTPARIAIALLVRLYPQRLGDILHQHFAFSSAMNLSEKLQQVDRLKAWLDSFRPLSPTLVAESEKTLGRSVHLSLQCAGGKYLDSARNRISPRT